MDQFKDLNRTTRRRNNRKKQQRQARILLVIGIAAVVLLAVGVVLAVIIRKEDKKPTVPSSVRTTESDEATTDTQAPPESLPDNYAEVIQEAEKYAAMYDYEKAVEYVKEQVPEYEKSRTLTDFVTNCNAKRSQLIVWNNGNNSNITHVFFHSLIIDEDIAWNSYKKDDYNQVMTTIDEFNEILNEMYEAGYVLVHLSDIAKIEKQEDGTEKMAYQPIYLPAGKIPFVFSVDDTAYYEYMMNTGCATKLIIDDNGDVINEYATYKTDPAGNIVTDANGEPVVDKVEYGLFDHIPLLDKFVEEHPDFSYHGAKGTIALTGYNGILGYKTSEIAYGAGHPDYPQAYEWKNTHIEEDRKEAARVAEAIKANGWKFASHTWGHMNMGSVVDQNTGTITSERFKRDTGWWMDEVAPLIGGTDIIIFAFGADIGTWRAYPDDSEAFLYLKSLGFDYYCNVDSSVHTWVQLNTSAGGSGYLRQGRRNLDGTYMYKALVAYKRADMTKNLEGDDKFVVKEAQDVSDLIDVYKVFSRKRPLPVPNVKVPEGMDPYSVFDVPDATEEP